MVVALIALFVSLSGNAAAVGLLVTSGQIKDRTIQVAGRRPGCSRLASRASGLRWAAGLMGPQGPQGGRGLPGQQGLPGLTGRRGPPAWRRRGRAVGLSGPQALRGDVAELQRQPDKTSSRRYAVPTALSFESFRFVS